MKSTKTVCKIKGKRRKKLNICLNTLSQSLQEIKKITLVLTCCLAFTLCHTHFPLLTISHIVVVGEEAVVVERRWSVSVFAHQQGWVERPRRWGNLLVLDWWWWRGWWGFCPAQRPCCCCCCSLTPPQHRGAQPSILSLKWGWRGVGQGTAEVIPKGWMATIRRARNRFWQLEENLQGEDGWKTWAWLEITHAARKTKCATCLPCSYRVQVWPDHARIKSDQY